MPRFGRRNREREWEAALGAARQELASAGDAVGVLDVDVQSPAAPEAAGDRFDAAVRTFMGAGELLEGASDPRALVAVGEALERTRYEIACTRALLDREEIPERTAPCLFDPAHGPSVAEIEWTAGDDAERLVPVCAADADRAAGGQHPHVKLIERGGRPAYYWDDPRVYGPLIEGYYHDFGGVRRLASLLRGTALGNALRSAGDRD